MPVCKDFIKFCFEKNIFLCPQKTLQSFSFHNELINSSIQKELQKINPKPNINILGFGLDEGCYEKTLGEFLLANKIAKSVNIYGFDPYALKTPGIKYLTPEELGSNDISFDLIIARWVLHHVELRHRWGDLEKCINQCSADAMVLIVEHGFLQKNMPVLEKKSYYLFNALFDIVANIGLRPRYFYHPISGIKNDFFIQYLELKDLESIKKNIKVNCVENIYEVGPSFPNQTLISYKAKI
jgi:hypothetical protein